MIFCKLSCCLVVRDRCSIRVILVLFSLFKWLYGLFLASVVICNFWKMKFRQNMYAYIVVSSIALRTTEVSWLLMSKRTVNVFSDHSGFECILTDLFSNSWVHQATYQRWNEFEKLVKYAYML